MASVLDPEKLLNLESATAASPIRPNSAGSAELEPKWYDKAGPWIDQIIEKLPDDLQDNVRVIKDYLSHNPILLWALFILMASCVLALVIWCLYFMWVLFMSTSFFREDCSEEGTWAGNIYTYLVVVLLQSGLFLLGRRVFVWAMGETTTAEMIGVGVNIGFVMLLMVKLLATAFLRAWGLVLWFTHTDECDKFLSEHYWNLFFVFKAQVVFLIFEIGILVYVFTELQKRADYAAVEDAEDDWTKETKGAKSK